MSILEYATVVAIAIGLLATVPIVLYGLDRSGTAAALAIVNVLIVIAALVLIAAPRRPGALAR